MSSNVQSPKIVAIVGAGVIGQGWAVSFLLHGWEVRLYDAVGAAAEAAAATVRARLAGVKSEFYAEDTQLDAGSLIYSPTLAGAVSDASLVIEAVTEALDVKRGVIAAIETVTAYDLPIASSTSAILPTALAAVMTHPARLVVAHPFNPTYLVPLVEVVPGAATSPDTIARVEGIMRSIGKRIVLLRREIEGFVGNRLQAAIVNEAMNLVRLQIASPADIDACVSDGLALRWAFFGPFETMDMNAAEGFSEYAAKFGAAYTELGKDLGVGEPWIDRDIATIEATLQEGATAADRAARFARRDQALVALRKLKLKLHEARQHGANPPKGYG